MERVGDPLLAAARLALDERGKGRGRVEVDLAPQPHEGGAVAHERSLALRILARPVDGGGRQSAREDPAQALGLARLGHELDRAQGARAARVGFLVLAREHEDAHLGRVREEVADELEAFVRKVRDGGKPQVDEREVGSKPLAQALDGGSAVVSAHDLVVGLQREGEAFRDERIVIHQEQPRLGFHAPIIGGRFRKTAKIPLFQASQFPFACQKSWSTSIPCVMRTTGVPS
jgi:hypothetical protein